jgi:hypothetical protein
LLLLGVRKREQRQPEQIKPTTTTTTTTTKFNNNKNKNSNNTTVRRMHWTMIMASAVRKHMHVPVGMGSQAQGLANKLDGLTGSWKYEAPTEHSFEYFRSSVVCFTTDLGTESQVGDAPAVPENLEIGGAMMDDNGGPLPSDKLPSGFLFQHGMTVLGVLHVLSNAVRQVHKHLRCWATLLPNVSALSSFLHHKCFRDRLKAKCFSIPRLLPFRSFFDTACPLLRDWRWLTAYLVIDHILGVENGLRAGWNLQSYGAPGTSAADEEADLIASRYDPEFFGGQPNQATMIKIVDQTVKSPMFWASCRMIYLLDRCVKELEGWARGCPCHELEGRTGQKECPAKGCRAPEMASGKLLKMFEDFCNRGYAELLLCVETLSASDAALILSCGLSRMPKRIVTDSK